MKEKSPAKAAEKILKLTREGKSREEIKRDHPDLARGWSIIEAAAGVEGATAPQASRPRGSGSMGPQTALSTSRR